MSTQPPDAPQPPPGLWDAIPQIAKELRDEFLRVSVIYFLIAIAVGVFAPNVVTLLGTLCGVGPQTPPCVAWGRVQQQS